MLTQLSEPLVFRAYYRIGGTGKTGLADVTATVYGPSGAVLVSAQAATEIGGGLYQYILSGSYTVIAGAYTALFSTANATVNTQQLAAEWLVGDNWLQSIDAAISSRLAATGYSAPNNSGIGSIIATLGSAGAGLTSIPSIPGMATATGVAAVLTAVNALTNQGARSGPVVPSVLVRPSSGSVAYVGYIRVWASGGSAEDPDSNALTIHAADRVGGNLDGHLASTSMARIQAGLYSFSYTVQSTDIDQPVYFFFSWASGGVAMTDGASTVVQDAEETSALAAIIATLGTPSSSIAGDIAALDTAVAALPTAEPPSTSAIVSAMDAGSSKLASILSSVDAIPSAPSAATIVSAMDAGSSKLASILSSVDAIPSAPSAAEINTELLGIDPTTYTGNNVGSALARLIQVPGTGPTIVLPSIPIDTNQCIVFLDSKDATGIIHKNEYIEFKLNKGAVTSTYAVLPKVIKLFTDGTGRLSGALDRNDLMIPSDSFYIVNSVDFGIINKRLVLSSSNLIDNTFDLRALFS